MNVAKKLVPRATRADLDALPPTWRGEIIDGTLYAFPRPRARHAQVESRLSGDLDGPFDRGRGGPGGWRILIEPGIELERAAELSPDIAGWRRERLPRLPSKAAIRVVPDWICEVLSPSTRGYDQLVKRPLYAQIGVRHLWYVDPGPRVLTVSRLEQGRWVELGTYGPGDKVRAEPFEEAELEVDAWFEGAEEDDETD
jgi:Uma2 family endonuclease